MTKKFYLAGSEIKQLVANYGSCLASDKITVDGLKVRFMYRETPSDEFDSGWRFFSGDETPEFSEGPDNFGIYDVNTIANYDPSIIPFLDSPLKSAFERAHTEDKFVATEFPIVED